MKSSLTYCFAAIFRAKIMIQVVPLVKKTRIKRLSLHYSTSKMRSFLTFPYEPIGFYC